jgi:hypothetical protein
MLHCQTFKQRIEELKEKAQNIEALLSEYKKTGDKQIAEEIDSLLKEIEEFKQEFKTKATQLIEEFIQRRDNKNENVEIIFDERDGRFIIDGRLYFLHHTHLDDFPNLIKEITGSFDIEAKIQIVNLPSLKKIGGDLYVLEAETINLPNIEEIGGSFWIPDAPTIHLPNIKKIGGDIFFTEINLYLNSLIEITREWRAKGILRGKIYKIIKEGRDIEEIP